MTRRTISFKDITFTQVNNDTSGNPRYVCHFTNILSDSDRELADASSNGNSWEYVDKCYQAAITKAKKIGGKKFHNKKYGGGIVFSTGDVEALAERIILLREGNLL